MSFLSVCSTDIVLLALDVVVIVVLVFFVLGSAEGYNKKVSWSILNQCERVSYNIEFQFVVLNRRT